MFWNTRKASGGTFRELALSLSKGENPSGDADNQQGRTKKGEIRMRYRIPYSVHSQSGSQDMVEIIEAATNEEAVREHAKFKRAKEANNGRYHYSYLVGGLIRVDQEEITTRIL